MARSSVTGSGDPRGSSPARRLGRARRRRRLVALATIVALAVTATVTLAGGGRPGGPGTSVAALRTATTATSSSPASASTSSASTYGRTARAASVRSLVVRAPSAAGPGWTAVAWVGGQPAAWLAARAGATLMRFDQARVHLVLHTGSNDGGVAGWIYGDEITPREIHHLVAGFNGGFKLSYANVGFVSGGRVAVPLKSGLASIVTYTDGVTGIGAWNNGVPTAHRKVFSVLQNQYLLVDRGVAAANVSTCVLSCWGATVGGVTVVARSGLGIRADGQLVWAAGEQLTPASLASALVAAGVVRAVELDINPDWVDGYLYTHHATGPQPVPVVPGQLGITGQLLAPDARDFLAVVAN